MRLKIALGLALTCFGFAQEPEILKRVLPGLSNATSIPLNIELKAEILDMVKEDQTARMKLLDFKNLSDQDLKTMSEIVLHIDLKHNQRLKEIISTYGWPGIQLVGLEGASGMWLLVQHQDKDLPFQQQCLALLKDAVERGDAQYREYAYLLDRVRMNENLLQVYGTQWEQKEGKYLLYPVEAPENLNQRRLEAGLNTLEEYAEQMKKAYHLEDAEISLSN